MRTAAALAGSLLLVAVFIPLALAVSVLTGFLVASGMWH